MVPVYLHRKGDKSGLSYNDFEAHISQICESHKRDGRALAFALLLFNFSSPGVFKVLEDKDYWLSLDKLSGDTLTVFSVHTPSWLFKDERRQDLDEIRGADPDRPVRHLLERYFPLEGEAPVPSILIFQVEDGEISDAYLVRIRERTVERLFEEIREIIGISVDSLRNVLPENKANTKQLFDLIVRDLRNLEKKKIFRLSIGAGLKVLGLSRMFGG